MTGDFDYLIRVVTPDLLAYQYFLDKLTQVEGLDHVKSSFSLKPICYKTELPLGHLICADFDAAAANGSRQH